MHKSYKFFALPACRLAGLFFLVFTIAFSGFVLADNSVNKNNIDVPSRKIIVFSKDVSDDEVASDLRDVKGVKIKRLRYSGNLVANLDNKAVARLSKNANVLRIEDDIVVEAFESIVDNVKSSSAKSTTKPTATTPAQVLPWGIDAIDAEKVWPLGETGTGINVGVIDTGISTTHPDLIANIKGGVSEVQYTKSYNDDNGHGSHVAGIIGAINNTAGVIGATPSVNLYAIKVLDRNGSGYLSDVVDGIDWAIANNIKVINMSLGANVDVQSFHDAVIRAKNAGVVVVAAAGNDGSKVSFPGAYPEAIAVGAVDFSNAVPYWSNRGPELDVVAPGVSIYSTYKGTRYATLSGTSMATPHVAATAALVLKSKIDTAFNASSTCVSVYDINCNGAWDPSEVQNKLQTTAIDLGLPGRDDLYGFGLISAFDAFMK